MGGRGSKQKSTRYDDHHVTKAHENKLRDEEVRVEEVIAEMGEIFDRLAEHDKTGVELKAELERQALVDSTGKLISIPHGKRLLRLACSSGNVGSASVLLEVGASPLGSPPEYMQTMCDAEELRDAEISCVHLAAAQDNAEMLELLLSTTAFGDLANHVQEYKIRDERTPLMSVASRYQHICRATIGKILLPPYYHLCCTYPTIGQRIRSLLALGRTETETNLVVTASFTTEVDHQTTVKA